MGKNHKIKELFQDTKAKKVLPISSTDEVGKQAESKRYLEERIKKKDRVFPKIDFTKPENFARFGSAEEYYEQSITRIWKTYPYDGSLYEKVAWENSSSYLDLYLFEKEYPRTNGYAVFSPGGWGTKDGAGIDAGAGYIGLPIAADIEYISFEGGPHKDPNNKDIKKIFPDIKHRYSGSYGANVYDKTKHRQSNLQYSASHGLTVEFWMKKEALADDENETAEECIFDLWNGSPSADKHYGRLVVDLLTADTSDTATPLFLFYQSGSVTGSALYTSLTNSEMIDNKWHHYALTLKNSGTAMETELYFDGSFREKQSINDAATATMTLKNDESVAYGTDGSMRFTLVSADGTSVEYAIYRAGPQSTGGTGYGYTHIQLAGYSTISAYTAQFKEAIESANGHAGKLTATISTVTNTNDTITITQVTKGRDGNTAIPAITGADEDALTINEDVGETRFTGGTGIINEVIPAQCSNSGSMLGMLGAFRTITGAEPAGYGKLSGSIDEFRYWKARRNAEEIGRFYRSQVGGGANVDDANTDLGVYFKFNEGITGKTSADERVLDYSGRLSNGYWKGYTSNSRNTGSAIVESSASVTEFKDPIIYPSHPKVKALLEEKTGVGREHDYTNNGAIYRSLPEWITSEDDKNGSELVKLTQIMASYFDTLAVQIKELPNIKEPIYTSGSHEPIPFSNRLLENVGIVTPDLFVNSSVFEEFLDRGEKVLFENSLHKVKNLIYQNIYNNLSYIAKTKGTEKSFRNLVRCFGVDDELINLNIYGNNVSYKFEEKVRYTDTKKKYIDFNHPSRNSACVFQFQDEDITNSISYISGSAGSYEESGGTDDTAVDVVTPFKERGVGITFEYGTLFPKTKSTFSKFAYPYPGLSSSIGGVHSAKRAIQDSTASMKLLSDTITDYGNDGSMRFTLVSADGTSVEYAIYRAGPQSTGGTGYGYTHIQLAGYSTISAYTAQFKEAIESANGHAGKLTTTISTVTNTNDTITVSQMSVAAGSPAANTTIPAVEAGDADALTINGGITATSFGGTYPAQNLGWSKDNLANFQIFAARDKEDSTNVKFILTGSAGGFMPELSSSLFYNVYDNEKWDFAIKIRPENYPWSPGISGSYLETSPTAPAVQPSYNVEFYGVNTAADIKQNSFLLTASLTKVAGDAFLNKSKRIFVGAHRTDFSGTVLQTSDIKVGSARVWMDYLPNNVIDAHARDVLNFGTEHPYESAHLFEAAYVAEDFPADSAGGLVLTSSLGFIPQMDTLALHWDFNQVTGSDSSGEFKVSDFSSGSIHFTTSDGSAVRKQNDFGPIGAITGYRHTGLGYDFPISNTDVADIEYISTARQLLPEHLNSSDMIKVLSSDDIHFESDTRPESFYFAAEKSMYRTVSEEMLNFFATIKDFNNLIGEPQNRYRLSYKRMAKIRHMFFQKVRNTPDLDKYIEYYKWIDEAVNDILEQLFPASAAFSNKLRTVVESHILERNKYANKYPTIEDRNMGLLASAQPEGRIEGNSAWAEAAAKGERGNSAPREEDEKNKFAPAMQGSSKTQANSRAWWRTLGADEIEEQSSGDAAVDESRRRIFNSTKPVHTNTGIRRLNSQFPTPRGQSQYRFRARVATSLRSGDNSAEHTIREFPQSLRPDGTINPPSIQKYITIKAGTSHLAEEDRPYDRARPQFDPSYNILRSGHKTRLLFEIENNADKSSDYGSAKGTLPTIVSIYQHGTGDSDINFGNLHKDFGPTVLNTSLQGHTTQKWSGGSIHRKVDLNIQPKSTGEFDTIRDRPEKFRFEADTQASDLRPFVSATATITITDAGQVLADPGAEDTISVVTTAGDTVTITAHADTNAMSDTTGESLLGTFSAGDTASGGSANNITQAGHIATVLNLHDDLTATNDSSATVTITQKTAGPAGNTDITLGGSEAGPGMTVVNFAGGVVHKDVKIYPPDSNLNGTIDMALPRVFISEDTKRPVSTKYVRLSTGSIEGATTTGNQIGNYQHNYDFLQTSGRTYNNKWLRENYTTAQSASENPSLRLEGTQTDGINIDFSLPVRPKDEFLIVNRFSSPGDFTTMTRGYLDPAAEEYSAYNALPWRYHFQLNSSGTVASSVREWRGATTPFGNTPVTSRADGEKATAIDVLDVSSAGYADAFTVNVPSDASGTGTTVTVIMKNTTSGTPDANEIWYHGAGSSTEPRDRLILAINGTDDSSVAKYGNGADTLTDANVVGVGIKGLTAAVGTATNPITLIASTATADGNDIEVIQTVGSNIVDTDQLTDNKLTGGKEKLKINDYRMNIPVHVVQHVTTSNHVGEDFAGLNVLLARHSGKFGISPLHSPSATATITITDAGQILADPDAEDTISIVTTAGDTVTITAHADTNDMSDTTGESLLGTFSAGDTASGGSANNITQAGHIATVLNLHDDLTATNDSSATVTITQNTGGTAGNTDITLGGSEAGPGMTVVSFTGGGKGAREHDYQTKAAYHKVHRNRLKRLELTSTNDGASYTVVTASTYDNAYVRHSIPRNDLQYAWITASAFLRRDPLGVQSTRLGYDGKVKASLNLGSVATPYVEALTFISRSEVCSFVSADSDLRYWSQPWYQTGEREGSVGGSTFVQRIPVDFAGMNLNIYEPITSSFGADGRNYDTASINTLGFPSMEVSWYDPNFSDVNYLNSVAKSTVDSPSHGWAIYPVYSNTTADSGGEGTILNALILHRQGPYGYPSWKQVRAGDHPVARYNRSKNIIQYIEYEEIKYTQADKDADNRNKSYYVNSFWSNPEKDKNRLNKAMFKTAIKSYISPPITNRYLPMVHTVAGVDENGQVNTMVLKHSYGNLLSYTPYEKLNENLQIVKPGKNKVVYDKLTKSIKNKETGLIKLTYREKIYPKEKFTYLAKTRQRGDYTEVSSSQREKGIWTNKKIGFQRTFWKDAPTARRGGSQQSVTNSLGFIQDMRSSPAPGGTWPHAGEGTPDHDSTFAYMLPSLSIWPLDGGSSPRLNGKEKFNEATYLAGELMALHAPSIYASIEGFRLGTTATPMVAAATASQQYCYPGGLSSQYYTLSTRLVWYRPWDAALHDFYRTDELSGIKPWYNSYEDYAQEIRCMAKDHTIIPEFRISENMSYYIDNGFVVNNKFLTLEGAYPELSASADSEKSDYKDDFFKVYSHSDFMKYYGKISDDHENLTGLTKITLKCHGIKKLLPYQGFYPVLRSVQLGSMFSSSFAPYISGSHAALLSTADTPHGTTGTSHGGQIAAMMQPFFAPGILYNTVKSGVAVDWPMVTSSHLGTQPAAAGYPGYNASYLSGTAADGKLFNWRMPFEALVEPHRHLPLSQSDGAKTMFYAWNRSGSIPRGPWWDYHGINDHKYALAMQNFLGEIPRFFLKDESFKTFASAPQSKFKAMESGSIYYMDVVLKQTHDFVMSEGPRRIQMLQADNKPILWDIRGCLYGPPCQVTPDSTSNSRARFFPDGNNDGTSAKYDASANFSDPAFAPFTPPHFYQDAIARITFSPHSASIMSPGEVRTFSLDEIVASAMVETTFTGSGHSTDDLENKPGIPVVGLYPSAIDVLDVSSAAYADAFTVNVPMKAGGTGTTVTVIMKNTTSGTPDTNEIWYHGAGSGTEPRDRLILAINGTDDSSVAKYGAGVTSGEDWGILGITALTGTSPKISISAWYTNEHGNEIEFIQTVGSNIVDTDQLSSGKLFGGNSNANNGRLCGSGRYISKLLDAAQRDLYPAGRYRMRLSSSMNLFGKTRLKTIEYETDSNGGGESFKPTKATDTGDPAFDVWTISPKFECPTLNFSGSSAKSLVEQRADQGLLTTDQWVNGITASIGTRAMWGGYGEIPSVNSGLWLSLRESFPDKLDEAAITDSVNAGGIVPGTATRSLLKVCGFKPEKERIGELADKKLISEAIVAVPFVIKNSKRHFFTIDKVLFDIAMGTKKQELGKDMLLPGKSIKEMVAKLKNYYLPPHMDFMRQNSTINPFVIYVFEFTHELDKEDLSHIWQNLMPKIARSAIEQEVVVGHNLDSNEFFGGFKIPKDIQWMVFKIKKRAEMSYYNVTADSEDDSRFAFEFKLGGSKKKPDYNYNWPYDFFSLVELADIKAEFEFDPAKSLSLKSKPIALTGDGELFNMPQQPTLPTSDSLPGQTPLINLPEFGASPFGPGVPGSNGGGYPQ